MSVLRGAVLGVVTGAAAFVALQHADRLRALVPADAAVEQIAEVVRAALPEAAATPVGASAQSAGETAEADPPASPTAGAARIDPEALQGLAIEAPPAREPDPPIRGGSRAVVVAAEAEVNEGPDATPSLAEARRRAADVAAAVERLGRRLERGGGR